MTPLEIIDIAEKGLMNQGMKSMSYGHDAKCMYRGPEGRKCGVGFLIPDELYTTEIEDVAVSALTHFPEDFQVKLLAEILRKAGLLHDYMLLQEIQRIHDHCEPEDWEEEFKELRRLYDCSSSG